MSFNPIYDTALDPYVDQDDVETVVASTSGGIQVGAGTKFTATLVDPPGALTGLGARVEMPVTRAIVAAFQFAVRQGGVWTVTLDAPLQPGGYQLVWMTSEDPPVYSTMVPLSCVRASELSTGANPVFPSIDTTAVRPTVDDIARLLRTRTKTDDGEERDTFDSDTIVSEDDVNALIDDALQGALAQLPDQLDPLLYGRVRYAVALQTAILVESSFFRTQETGGAGSTGVIGTYTRLYTQTMSRLTLTTTRFDGLS